MQHVMHDRSDMGQAAQLPPAHCSRSHTAVQTHTAVQLLFKKVHLMLCATFNTRTVHSSI